jgi:16S rRNA (guanine966-N2)-methyltransferase
VREALFMSLEPLAGLRVVDLFAGSGALGIEALSRGATWVDFVERAEPARRALESNLAALALEERSKVWSIGLPAAGSRLEAMVASADLVLMDPPYGGRLAMETLAWLDRVVRPGARVVVEHHAKDALPDETGGLERVRERRYGETAVSVYRARERESVSRGGSGP